MKICSLNIRGLRMVIKKKKIRSLVTSERVDFMTIQETKMDFIDSSLCQQLGEIVISIRVFLQHAVIQGKYSIFGIRQ